MALGIFGQMPLALCCLGPCIGTQRRIRSRPGREKISGGLQSVGKPLDRVEKVNDFFGKHQSGDKYERDAITHVMECNSRFPGLFVKEYDEMLIENQME